MHTELNLPGELTAISLLAQRGLQGTWPKGAPAWSPHLVNLEHDGVPYCLDLSDGRRGLNAEGVDRALNKRKLLIERHHELVKALLEHCVKHTGLNIWIRCGGGSQLQASFGCSNGHLGVLYLDLDNPAEQWELAKSGLFDCTGDRRYLLQVCNAYYNEMFDAFQHPDVNVRALVTKTY